MQLPPLISSDASHPQHRMLVDGDGGSFATFKTAGDWFDLLSALFCVVCASLAAGLTLGFMSLDVLKLQIKSECGTPEEKKAAGIVLPSLADKHQLLCTLLIFNSLAQEALPVCMDAIVPSWVAVIISVTLVLVCGEVIPAAIFTGPDQLFIAARLKPLVTFLTFIFYPVAKPMALGLDKLLGVETDDILNRDELVTLMQITRLANINQFEGKLLSGNINDASDTSMTDMLSQKEVNTISGVLVLAKSSVKDLLIPWDKVSMLSSDVEIDTNSLPLISKASHSVLPVYEGTNRNKIIGFIRTKTLAGVNPRAHLQIKSCKLDKVLVVGVRQGLHDILHTMQRNQSRLAIVSEDPMSSYNSSYRPYGIITMKDIFKRILLEKQASDRDPNSGKILQTFLRQPSLAKSLSTNPAFSRSLSVNKGTSNDSDNYSTNKYANGQKGKATGSGGKVQKQKFDSNDDDFAYAHVDNDTLLTQAQSANGSTYSLFGVLKNTNGNADNGGYNNNSKPMYSGSNDNDML